MAFLFLRVDAATMIKWIFLPSNKKFVARIAGFRILMRARTTDLPISVECLTAEYESIAMLFPSDYEGVFVDAGAHIGGAAVRLASLFPNARIVCIEPSSDNLNFLKANTQHIPRIEIRHAALVAEPSGRVILSDRGKGGSGYTVVTCSQDSAKLTQLEEVDTISMTELLTEFGSRIGLVKLDIEGAEREIFSLAAFQESRIPVVFAELHERINPGCESAFMQFSASRWNLPLGYEKFLSLYREK